MMEQSFPATQTPRLLVRHIDGDLIVTAWDEPTFALRAEEELRELHQEGDLLVIEGCAGTLDLRVPVATALEAEEIHGDTTIAGLRAIALRALHGDLTARNSGQLIAQGSIAGDVELNGVLSVALEHVDGDLRVRVAGSGAAPGGEAAIHVRAIGGDALVDGEITTTIVFKQVDGDLKISRAGALQLGDVGGDCTLRSVGQVELGDVGGDLRLDEAASLRARSIGGDAKLAQLAGSLELGDVSGDLRLDEVASLRVAHVSGDANLRAMRGPLQLDHVDGDLVLSGLEAVGEIRASVEGDAVLNLPSDANLQIRAIVAGSVQGASLVAQEGDAVQIIYGSGATLCELRVEGDLHVRGTRQPRSSTSRRDSWVELGREFGDLGRELGDLGREFAQEVAAACKVEGKHKGAAWAEELAQKVERAARRVEERSKAAESRVHASAERHAQHDTRAERLRIRINDREWNLDPARIERIKEQARRAAAEGLAGALEAVERAFAQIRVATPNAPAASASASAAPPPATGQTIRIEVAPERDARASAPARDDERERERETILRMIAEGRISPEEGDLLLEALAS